VDEFFLALLPMRRLHLTRSGHRLLFRFRSLGIFAEGHKVKLLAESMKLGRVKSTLFWFRVVEYKTSCGSLLLQYTRRPGEGVEEDGYGGSQHVSPSIRPSQEVGVAVAEWLVVPSFFGPCKGRGLLLPVFLRCSATEQQRRRRQQRQSGGHAALRQHDTERATPGLSRRALV